MVGSAHNRRTAYVHALLSITTAGCSSASVAELDAVPAFEEWTDTPENEDVFPDHRPSGIFCLGVFVENGALEMITTQCNYASRSAGLTTALPAGTTITGTFEYDDLVPANENTTSAHAAIALGEQILWERTVSIPADAAVVPYEITLDGETTKGTLLTFHLHNHGLNNYRWTMPVVVAP